MDFPMSAKPRERRDEPVANDGAELRLEGAPNFRDIGGIAVAGGRLGGGRVFRSDRLAHLTPADLAALQKIDLRLVCDVRSQAERDRHPNRLPVGHRAEQLHLDIHADLRADVLLADIVRDDPTARGARRMMVETYRRMPVAFAGRLHQFFDPLIDADGLPALVHCSAGKDRTGFVIAMLLLAVGASMEAVLGDYMLTAERQDTPRREVQVSKLITLRTGIEPPIEVARTIVTVHEEYLGTAMASIGSTYGGLDAYLQKVGGLDRRRRESLRERLMSA